MAEIRGLAMSHQTFLLVYMLVSVFSGVIPKTGIELRILGKLKQKCPGAESNHRHEDFQSDLNFLNLIKSVTYARPISICASKRQ